MGEKSIIETDIYVPQRLNPDELAYKFPPASSDTTEELDEMLSQSQVRGSSLVVWDNESDTLDSNPGATQCDFSSVRLNAGIFQPKLSWPSSISVDDNSVTAYSPSSDNYKLIANHKAIASWSDRPPVHMAIQEDLSQHSSGCSVINDDEDSASVCTEDFDNWIQQAKYSDQNLQNDNKALSTSSIAYANGVPAAKIGVAANSIAHSDITLDRAAHSASRSPELVSKSSNVNSSAAEVSYDAKASREETSRRANNVETHFPQYTNLPDTVVLEYKDDRALIVESSTREKDMENELESETILLHIPSTTSDATIRNVAAIKIQAIWRGYQERKLNPPSNTRVMMLLMTLSTKFQAMCNDTADRKLRSLKHRILQESRFRMRSERQLQKLGDVNRKERDELCRLLEAETATLESHERLVRETSEKADLAWQHIQDEKLERENLERVVHLAAKEISAQNEREINRNKDMDAIYRRVEKLASELKSLKQEQSSSYSRVRRSISPTSSTKSLSLTSETSSQEARAVYKHRIRPSAVPRMESEPYMSKTKQRSYSNIPSSRDIAKTVSNDHKYKTVPLKGKSLIPTNSTTTPLRTNRDSYA
ncbi:hypothetical protein INT43_008001 [Umbelopsis isabellina]|uniref:Uncharacterized protein n=1 Tax=Mortierella isabellina TaxID=91625 RepID=A0A8H7PN88_MORIS|nr:hypothetical protein INT43_008001 [Umbelopsis isabellina]